MARPRVFVTRRMPQEALDLLAAETELEVWPEEEHPPREMLLDRASRCAGLFTTIEDRIDEELLVAGQNILKVVANLGVGYDNFDVEAATRHGVAGPGAPADTRTKTRARRMPSGRTSTHRVGLRQLSGRLGGDDARGAMRGYSVQASARYG